MKIKNVKNFIYEEFFPKEYFEEFKKNPNYYIWMMNSLDQRIPPLAQFVRNRYDRGVTINDWVYKKNGNYNYSGVRPLDCKDGAKLSRHKLGLCIDVKISGMEAPEVQEDIIKNYDVFKEVGLTTLEINTPTWTHLSVENTDWRQKDELWLITP
jgi:hypothetical protein